MKHSKEQLKAWSTQLLFNPHSNKAINVIMTLARGYNMTPQQVVDRLILLSK